MKYCIFCVWNTTFAKLRKLYFIPDVLRAFQNYRQILNIIKCFFWIYWENYMTFPLKSGKLCWQLIYYWTIFPFLDKHYLIIIYLFHTLLDLNRQYFISVCMCKLNRPMIFLCLYCFYLFLNLRFYDSHAKSSLKFLRIFTIHCSTSFPIGKLFRWPIFCPYK